MSANSQSYEQSQELDSYALEQEAMSKFKGYHEEGLMDDFGYALDGWQDRNQVACGWSRQWLISNSTYGGFDWLRTSSCCLI